MQKGCQQFLGRFLASPLTHCDLKQSLFYSCSSLHPAWPAQAGRCGDDIWSSLGHQGRASSVHHLILIGWLPCCGDRGHQLMVPTW